MGNLNGWLNEACARPVVQLAVSDARGVGRNVPSIALLLFDDRHAIGEQQILGVTLIRNV
jgi:hypothetical protein